MTGRLRRGRALMTKTIGILTAGGDSPGLNAAIRGVGKAALGAYGMHVIGFRDGFRGLVENRTTTFQLNANYLALLQRPKWSFSLGVGYGFALNGLLGSSANGGTEGAQRDVATRHDQLVQVVGPHHRERRSDVVELRAPAAPASQPLLVAQAMGPETPAARSAYLSNDQRSRAPHRDSRPRPPGSEPGADGPATTL